MEPPLLKIVAPSVAWVVALAPLWAVALAFVAHERTVRGLFVASVLACLGSCLFAGAHSGDRDPLQWTSAMLSLSALWLMLSMGCAWFVACWRRERPRSSAPPR